MPVAGKRLLRSVVNWRGLESGRSKELTKTFVSKTQRNYAPFRRESSISGVSPRSFALRPTQPKAQQCLHLSLLLWSGGVVRPRRLRVQRNRDRGLRHGANLPSFYGKYPLPATLARSARPLGFVVLNFATV